MPEGDTIWRAARTMHLALAGRVVTGFETALAQLARANDDAPFAGRTIDAVESAGKHLLVRFSGGLVLRTHQRMHGSWHLYRPGERWRKPRSAMRVVLATDAWVAVAFHVPVAELLDPGAVARQPDLRALGPDLLDPAFDAEEAVRRMRARGPGEPVDEVLLNQRVLAGIGNEFKSEVLFAAGVHPACGVGSLSDEELRRLVEVALRQLRANRGAAGGDAFAWRGGRRTTGRMDPRARLWVYGRGGEPCRRCGAPVAYARRGIHARGTYWCPRCQPAR
jgi:endonuclease-8